MPINPLAAIRTASSLWGSPPKYGSRPASRSSSQATPTASPAPTVRRVRCEESEPEPDTPDTDDDFALVDDTSSETDTESFEMTDGAGEYEDNDDLTIVNDATGIEAAKPRALEKALPPGVVRKVDGTAGGIKSVVRTVMNTPGLVSKATTAGFSAAKEELMASNPFDPRSYNPLAYVTTGMAAGAATVVGAAAKTSQGVKEVNHDITLKRAEAFLRAGLSALSQEQISTLKNWIGEARRGLNDFTSKNWKSLEEAMQDADESDHELPADIKGTAEEIAAAKAKLKELKAKRAARRAASSQNNSSGPAPITFKTLLKGAEEVSASMNPDLHTLLKHAPKLANLLEALERVVQLPNEICKTTQAAFYERMREDNTMGSREFIDSLVTRGAILVDNAHKPASEQNKRVLIAISGPGTCKTTNIRKMAEWAGQPLCMLTGEAFCRMPIPDDKDAFDVFEEWVKSRWANHFSADGKSVINGILLLDDFHFALEGNGPFAMDSQARKKFFHFLKNLADANQESVVSGIELAPGRVFPSNLVRTQVFITLNRLPSELADDGEEALTSRCININVAYPSEQDRNDIALNFTGKRLRRVVEKQMGWKGDDFERHMEMSTFHDCLLQISQLDANFAKTMDGQLGVRALSDLLERYEKHVLKKLDNMGDVLDPDLFSYSGQPAFDPAKVAEEIKDYKKGRDENLSRIESKRAITRQVAELRKACETLPPVQAQAIGAILDKQDKESALEMQRAVVNSAQRLLNAYTNRVPLPDARDFGKALLDKFGYLKSSGADGEADRFDSIANVAKELYIRRAAARTSGYRENKIIRVRFTDPSAADPSIYGDLAKILGGVPVHFLLEQDSLLHQDRHINTIRTTDSAYHTARSLVNHNVFAEFEGSRWRASWQQEVVDGKAFFYLSGGPANTDGERAFLVLNSDGIKHCTTDSPANVDINTPGIYVLRGKEGFPAVIRRHARPQLNIFEELVAKVGDKASAAETFLVGCVDNPTTALVEQWRLAQNDTHPDKYARDVFDTYLHAQLNAAQIKLNDGSTLDPRSLTLFLMDDPAGIATYCGNAEVATTMTLGVPPVEGRKMRAESTLKRELTKVREEANKNLTLFGKKPIDELHLSDDERAVFERLIVWDMNHARRAREVETVLPTSCLDQCVQTLVQRVGDRATDYFGLNAASILPSIAAFEKEWSETYHDHLQIIESAFYYREQAERTRIENERRAEQQKRDEEERRIRREREEEERRLRREREPRYRSERRDGHEFPPERPSRIGGDHRTIPPPPSSLAGQRSWSDEEDNDDPGAAKKTEPHATQAQPPAKVDAPAPQTTPPAPPR